MVCMHITQVKRSYLSLAYSPLQISSIWSVKFNFYESQIRTFCRWFDEFRPSLSPCWGRWCPALWSPSSAPRCPSPRSLSRSPVDPAIRFGKNRSEIKRKEESWRCPSVRFLTHFFYTNKSYMGRWLEDWREKKNFEDHGKYSPFCFFYAGWACAKNLPTQAEPALKNCLRRLSLR